MDMDKLQLFYVEDSRAYFVDTDPAWFRFEGDEGTQRLSYFGESKMPKPWSVYSRNKIVKVYFESPYLEVVAGSVSARMLNGGVKPWLMPTDWKKETTPVMAGTSLGDFIRVLTRNGAVYLPTAAE